MTATKTRAAKDSARKPAAKPAPKGKATPAPKEPAKPTKAAPKEKPAKPEPKTLIEALSTGQAVLLKVRANGSKRSLPYLAVRSKAGGGPRPWPLVTPRARPSRRWPRS